MYEKLKFLSGIFATTSILLGMLVIMGWVYDFYFPQKIESSYFLLKINTAVSFIILGIAILILNEKETPSFSAKVILSAICFLVLATSILTLCQYTFKWNLSLDHLLLKDPVRDKNDSIQMSAIISVNLSFSAIAIFIRAFRPANYRAIQSIIFFVFITSLLAFGAKLYATRYYYGLSYYIKMPVLTSLSFICIALGLLCAQKQKGIMSFFTSKTIGGTVARRLIPMVIILPLVLGWLRIKGEEFGLYGPHFGTAIFSVSVITVLIIVILWNVKRLIQTDKQRIVVENSLKQSDERLRIIFDQAPYAMIVMDEAGIITRWNQRAEEIFGWTDEEVLGKVLHKLIIPERYRAMHVKGIERFMESGKGPLLNKSVELSALKKDGIEFPVDFRISFIRQNDQYIFIAFLNDITEQKKAALELNKKSEDLRIANKELEQFAYVASHDLQEPLRTISNFVGLIEKKYKHKIDTNANEYIRFIVKATIKMRNLIKDLLDLSRIGRNVVFKPIDCTELIKEVLSEMEISILESHAKIRFGPLPIILGNLLEIKLLFQNLISNAIKFRKKNEVAEITITVEEKENEFLFAIKDNGIGIEEQYKEKIFIIFQRLHNSEEYPGTGIGLATCKKIVIRHKGNIWVESEPGRGSTFYFTIPKQHPDLTP